jgi:hypothetical protein
MFVFSKDIYIFVSRIGIVSYSIFNVKHCKEIRKTRKNQNIGRSNEILDWEGVGNRQLFWFFEV